MSYLQMLVMVRSSQARRNYGNKLFAGAIISHDGNDSNGGSNAMLLFSSNETSQCSSWHIEGALRAAERTVRLISP